FRRGVHSTVISRLAVARYTLPMRNPLAVVTFLLCGCAGGYAQSTFGVVLGTVKDASGGVVKQASVRLTNLGENIARDTITSEDGAYEFHNMKPVLYSVRVSHPGFRTFTAQDLTLVARQILRVDAALQLGEVSEMVEVRAAV